MVPLAVQKSFTGVSHRYLRSGCGLAVGPEPPKLVTRVRIPAPAYSHVYPAFLGGMTFYSSCPNR